MFKAISVVFVALCVLLYPDSSFAGRDKGKGKRKDVPSYEKYDRDDKHRRGDRHRDRDRDDDRDDDCDDDDDDDCRCGPSIPTPTPATPPTTTSANFLNLLSTAPASTSLASSLGNVSKFYTPAEWAAVVAIRGQLGNPSSRQQFSVRDQGDIIGVKGNFRIVTYETVYPNGQIRYEVVGMELGADGVWRVAYYNIEQPSIANFYDESM